MFFNRLNLRALVFVLATLILSSCLDSQIDDPDAESTVLPERILEGDTLSSACIEKLGEDLLEAGFQKNQVSVIQTGAEQTIKLENLAESDQIGRIAPQVLKGAELAVAQPTANLTTAEEKIAAINVIVATTTASLNGRVSAGSSANSKNDSFDGNGSKTIVRYESSTPSSYSYSDILKSLTSIAVSYLDDAGIEKSDIADSIKSVVKNIAGNLIQAGVDTNDIAQISLVIAEHAVGSLDEAGVDTATVENALEAVVSGAFIGLQNAGLSSDAITALADDVAKGAVLGLDESGVEKKDIGTLASVISSGIENGLLEGGVAQSEIDAVKDDIELEIENGKGAIVGITIDSVNGLSTTESGGTASFTIRLNTQPTEDVALTVASSDLEEGTVSPSSLTFTNSNWSSDQEITATGTDDDLTDGYQSYTIVINAAVSSDADYNGIDPEDVIIVNIDNELIFSTFPGYNAEEVSTTTTIAIVFTKEMDPSTISSETILVNDDNIDISGDIEYDNTRLTATFSPSERLKSHAVYSVTATTGIEDNEAGVHLLEDLTWNFKTASDILTLGDRHSCIKPNSGDVRCWGWNRYGQLGQGGTADIGDDPNEIGVNLPTIDIGSGRTVLEVVGGYYHTCVLLDNGKVKCWGRSNYGQLGLGDSNSRGDDTDEMGDNLPAVELGTGRTALHIAAGSKHTCAILDNKMIKCWGYNQYGGLGLNDTFDRGDGVDENDATADEMGDALPYVALGTGRTAEHVDAGSYHTCAILDDDSVKCWGRSSKGQLGLGDAYTLGDGKDEDDITSDEMGDNLLVVNLGQNRTAVEIAVGNYHSCARLDNNTVKCWGYNSNGQLGLGDSTDRGINPGEMGDDLPAIDLGSGRTVLEISAGASHVCARLDDGNVKCWGSYRNGRLGRDVSDYIGDDPDEMGDNLPPVDLGTDRTAVEIATGNAQNCTRLDNDTIKCWGNNTYGQLGLGDKEHRGDDPDEMGDNLPAIDIDTD
ncbi:MAG: hypothetical protein GY866_30585 [Proteobacteria bacterium]|nr:hypothetical protein [Pseudomonadota bacterium]